MTTLHRPGPTPLPAWVPDDLNDRLRALRQPHAHLSRVVRECFRYLPPELVGELLDKLSSCWIVESSLHAVKIWGDRLENYALDMGAYPGMREDFGVVSRKVVTDNGVGLLVDTFDNTVANGDCRYHGIGTGTGVEAAADSALGTELTTEYNPDNTRATGTFSQPSANISRSVATNTLDSGTPAITEHAPFTQAANSGGTMLDRSKFAAINLVGANADGLQTTYSLTITSGS